MQTTEPNDEQEIVEEEHVRKAIAKTPKRRRTASTNGFTQESPNAKNKSILEGEEEAKEHFETEIGEEVRFGAWTYSLVAGEGP